jgi:hypothetical protein
MSKKSIARKGMKFVSAHNNRVCKLKHVKSARADWDAACNERRRVVFEKGLCTPEYDAAKEACDLARRKYDVVLREEDYITPHDRMLIAVFGAR